MSNISRVYSVGNIFEGPVDLYVNIAPPPSSLYPTADANCLTLDAAGQPTSATGFHCGSLEGPSSFTWTEKGEAISDDQHESPIDVAFSEFEAEMDFVLKETNLQNLNTILSANGLSTFTTLGNSQAWQIGGQFNSAWAPMSLLMVSPRRDMLGKFMYALGYKSFLSSPIAMPVQRKKETNYKLKAKMVMDLTRVTGDQVMQIVKQHS